MSNGNDGASVPSGPIINVWNRLEPRPRTENFDRTLRFEIRDALWMLTRQWQFGEFKGEDAGSAIFARVLMETSRISYYSQKDGKATDFNENMPLETRVEREPVPMDLMLRAQLGSHWFRLLASKKLLEKYKKSFLDIFPILIPEKNINNTNSFSNRPAWQLRSALGGRALDGGEFWKEMVINKKRSSDDQIAGINIEDDDKVTIRDLEKSFIKYFERLFSHPDESDTAWAPSHLEYQFNTGIPELGGKQTVLRAKEYYQGHLDWYSLDAEADPNARLDGSDEIPIDENEYIKEEIFSFLPKDVAFAGLSNRLWEYEDGRVNFGSVSTDTTDIAKLLLIENALIHGTDWLVVPYVVPTGRLCEIKGMVITNVFNERFLIKPAGSKGNEGWQKWDLFHLSHLKQPQKSDKHLFLPPVLGKSLEGPPIEKVTFLRDEMANMVWAVESIIPNDLGGGVNGYEAAVDRLSFISSFPSDGGNDEEALVETDASIRYVLGTSVPANWIPLIPKKTSGSDREIQLQRATMPSPLKQLDNQPVKPRGKILNPVLKKGETKYNIHEEEIPRAGAIVTRSYQRARWIDGTTHLWLGRRKQTGRGEGSSGLKFDQIEPKSEE